MKQWCRSLLAIVAIGLVASCYRPAAPDVDWGESDPPPAVFDYSVDARIPCWLRLDRTTRPVIRVNCFAIDGTLYTHSNRFVPLANLFGESWTANVETRPAVKVAIDGSVYSLTAQRMRDEGRRVAVLKDRGYWYVPDAIQVYRLR